MDGSGGAAAVTVIGHLTPRELLAQARTAVRSWVVATWIVGFLGVLTGILARSFPVVVLGLALVVIGWLLPRRVYQGRLDGPRVWTTTFSEDGLARVTDRGEAATYSWASVSKVVVRGGLRIFWLHRLVVPVSASALTAEPAKELLALLDRNGLVPESKR